MRFCFGIRLVIRLIGPHLASELELIESLGRMCQLCGWERRGLGLTEVFGEAGLGKMTGVVDPCSRWLTASQTPNKLTLYCYYYSQSAGPPSASNFQSSLAASRKQALACNNKYCSAWHLNYDHYQVEFV